MALAMPKSASLSVKTLADGIQVGQFFDFAKESINEAKKVVWPTRKETLKMTGLVFAFAVIEDRKSVV